jgi:RNA polymerase sigma-54 factor
MLKASLQLRLGQQLTMTPQLQQAIRLLQLPSLELQAHIRELLESNVMLEPEEDLDSTSSFEALGAGPNDHATNDEAPALDTARVEILEDTWVDQGSSASDAAWNASEDEDRAQDYQDASGQSLHEHLLWQLQMAPLSARELAIGQAVVDAVNDDGYLSEASEAIAVTLKPDLTVTHLEVEELIAIVQGFDPLGVAARSISECLQLQLAALDPATPGLATAQGIAAAHLDQVAVRDHTALRRALGIDDEELQLALLLVRGCHPRPGAQISAAPAEYVVPDVLVRRSPSGWTVEMNPSTLPRVRINQSYATLLGKASSHGNLKAQLQEARWLIKSLEIRHDTLLKVARSIVERQVDFLELGEEHMKPLILRDIAEAIDMHESTVSRVTSGKFMHTPRGVYELRYFFSSQVEGSDGSGTSSTAIRAKIRKLIREESPDAPLSDNRIAEILSREGIPVARRTVAKYREALGLATSSERKRRPSCN